ALKGGRPLPPDERQRRLSDVATGGVYQRGSHMTRPPHASHFAMAKSMKAATGTCCAVAFLANTVRAAATTAVAARRSWRIAPVQRLRGVFHLRLDFTARPPR